MPTMLETVIEQLNAVLERQLEELAGWVERGSGWVVEGIEKAYLDFARCDPIRGGHYLPLLKDSTSQKRNHKCKKQRQSMHSLGLEGCVIPSI